MALPLPLPLAKSTASLNEVDNGSVTFITIVKGCLLLLNTMLLSLFKSHTQGFLRVSVQKEFAFYFYFLFPSFFFFFFLSFGCRVLKIRNKQTNTEVLSEPGNQTAKHICLRGSIKMLVLQIFSVEFSPLGWLMKTLDKLKRCGAFVP